MKTGNLLLIAAVIYSHVVFGMRTLDLDECVTHTVKVSDTRPCTIMFPQVGGLETIQGTNITKTTKAPAGYFVEYVPRSNFFSIRATSDSPKPGYINVVYRRKIISLKLIYEKDVAKADNSVIFRSNPRGGSHPGASTPRVSPSELISLIDKSKSYQLLAAHRPEAVADVAHRRLMQVSSFPKFDIIVDEAWRYDRFDTIIFKLALKNKTARKLSLDLHSFAVRVGRTLYPAAIVQCAQTLPPSGTTLAYVGITGKPVGGRANLSLENLFKCLCTETEEAAVRGKEKLITAVRSIRESMSMEEIADVSSQIVLAESYDPGLKPVAERFRERLNAMRRELMLRKKLHIVEKKLDDIKRKGD